MAESMQIKRLFKKHPAFAGNGQTAKWPCHWIGPDFTVASPLVVLYRLNFTATPDCKFCAHVSADEKYILFADGKEIARGSESGAPMNWFYESYEFSFPPGKHSLCAFCWTLGEKLASKSHMSVHHGFIFAPEGKDFIELAGTGRAAWQFLDVTDGFHFNPVQPYEAFFAIFPETTWDVRKIPPEILSGKTADTDFKPARNISPHHHLKPGQIPVPYTGKIKSGNAVYLSESTSPVLVCDMDNNSGSNKLTAWNRMLSKDIPVRIPPRESLKILVSLDNYFCAFPEITVSGGKDSTVKISWSEALFEDVQKLEKGNRNEYENKSFYGFGDTFICDGETHILTTLWWRSGRFVEITVQTAETPLTIHSFYLRETHYPFAEEGTFRCLPHGKKIDEIRNICRRGLLMCAHDSFIDCPYYEQLTYSGDLRYEALSAYIYSRDSRLTKKCLALFADSYKGQGPLTASCYPSRFEQRIPSFSLWWICAVHDYFMWRGDPGFIREQLPVIRKLLAGFLGNIAKHGVLSGIFPGTWHMLDWTAEWNQERRRGVPAGAPDGINVSHNWLFVITLELAAELEHYTGSRDIEERYQNTIDILSRELIQRFWDDERKLFAEDCSRQEFSEHCQCLALLSGKLPDNLSCSLAEALFSANLIKTSPAFTHYYFEVCAKMGRMDKFFERLDDYWGGFLRKGFKTPLERFYPPRSDCHGWGSHPLYHFNATLLGIRPSAPGFRKVLFAPNPGPLCRLAGTVPHPEGIISAEFSLDKTGFSGKITLPGKLSGVFRFGGRAQNLHPGKNIINKTNRNQHTEIVHYA